MNELNEAQISALLDGETGRHETLAVIDQLVESEELRSFYRGARRLARLVDEAGAAAAVGDLPPDLWDRIQQSAAAQADASRPSRGGTRLRWRWGLQAAALVVIAIGTWWLAADVRRQPAVLQPDDGVVSVALASEPEAMTDARFIELTTELLKADRHYHEQLYEILRAVRGPEREGGSEGLLPLRDGRPRLQLANADDGRPRVWD